METYEPIDKSAVRGARILACLLIAAVCFLAHVLGWLK
jgi:hypothetical protein